MTTPTRPSWMECLRPTLFHVTFTSLITSSNNNSHGSLWLLSITRVMETDFMFLLSKSCNYRLEVCEAERPLADLRYTKHLCLFLELIHLLRNRPSCTKRLVQNLGTTFVRRMLTALSTSNIITFFHLRLLLWFPLLYLLRSERRLLCPRRKRLFLGSMLIIAGATNNQYDRLNLLCDIQFIVCLKETACGRI